MVGGPSSHRIAASLVGLCVAAGCTAAPVPLAPREPTTAELQQQVRSSWDAWSAGDLASADCSLFLSACTDRFVRNAGLAPEGSLRNPKAYLSNPSAEWLPGWDKVASSDAEAFVVFRGLTYARSMQLHFDQCAARHKERLATLEQVEARIRKEKATLEQSANPYVVLGGLLRLRAELKGTSTDFAGPRYGLELLIAESFDKFGRKQLYDFQHQRDDDAALLRPLFSPAEELELSCLQGLPNWQEPAETPLHLVKSPSVEGRREELEKRVREARDLELKLPESEVALPSYDAPQTVRGLPETKPATKRAKPAKAAPPPEPVLAALGREAFGAPLSVKSLNEDAQTNELLLTLVGRAEKKAVPYDCKPADKPSGVGPDGKLNYEQDCKTRDEMRTVTLRVRVAERPDTGIQIDDELALWVLPLNFESSERRLPNGTFELAFKGEVRAFHILELWRRGLVVAEYFF
jgi:hypothetical protein